VLSLLGLILAISLAMCVGQGRRGRRLNPPGARQPSQPDATEMAITTWRGDLPGAGSAA